MPLSPLFFALLPTKTIWKKKTSGDNFCREEKAALLHFDEIFLLFQNHLYNIRDGANEGVTSFYHDSYSSQ
jgi:hypothetical protein